MKWYGWKLWNNWGNGTSVWPCWCHCQAGTVKIYITRVSHLPRSDPQSQSCSHLLFIAVSSGAVNVSVPAVQSCQHCLLHLRNNADTVCTLSLWFNNVNKQSLSEVFKVAPVLERSSMCRVRPWASSAPLIKSQRCSCSSSEVLTEERQRQRRVWKWTLWLSSHHD